MLTTSQLKLLARKRLEGAYREQKNQALRKGTEFLLTFEAWLAIWEASGHLEARGTRAGNYVMARIDPTQGWTRRNVKIITTETFKAEQGARLRGDPRCSTWAGARFSEETKARMRASQQARRLRGG